MSDRADTSSEQSPVDRLGDVQVVRFVSDALRAEQRTILVTGHGQVSVRVPEAALTACASVSAKTLHIGPPLPEPPDLQEMIGAAVGIAGGRAMTPGIMARQLRLAQPKPRLIFAIDDAHTLSRQSLGYLARMIELLASDGPILQIVLAAKPTLLERLVHPEFKALRNSLCRPEFETVPAPDEEKAKRARLGPEKPLPDRPPPGLAPARDDVRTGPLPSDHGLARPMVNAAVAVIAMSCLAAIGLGYIVLPDFVAGPTLSSVAPPSSAAQLQSAGLPDPSRLGAGATDQAIDSLIDEIVNAVAAGTVEASVPLLELAKVEADPSPEGLKFAKALPGRLAARAAAAAAAGHADEEQRLAEACRLAYSAVRRPDLLAVSKHNSLPSPTLPGAAAVPANDDARKGEATGDHREAVPVDPAPAPEQPGGAHDGNRTISTPKVRELTASNAAGPDPTVAQESLAREAPDESPALPSEQSGAAADADRAALPENAATLAASSPAPEPKADAAPPATLAKAEPAAPDMAAAPSAETSGAGEGDRDASPANAATAAVASAAPEQNADAAPPAMLAKADPGAADNPPARVGMALPDLAPIRVVLNVGSDESGRAANIRSALGAAGLQVADLASADARRRTASIGYYFQSDRNAAADVGRLLQSVLGAVDPVELRIKGSVPEPGTIEIAIP